jgi:hypothetical protein
MSDSYVGMDMNMEVVDICVVVSNIVGMKEEEVVVVALMAQRPILETCMGRKVRKQILDLKRSIFHRDLRRQGT